MTETRRMGEKTTGDGAVVASHGRAPDPVGCRTVLARFEKSRQNAKSVILRKLKIPVLRKTTMCNFAPFSTENVQKVQICTFLKRSQCAAIAAHKRPKFGFSLNRLKGQIHGASIPDPRLKLVLAPVIIRLRGEAALKKCEALY